MIQKFLDATVRKKVVAHLEPVRVSFSNVAKDINRLDQYSRESRDLLERWNAYFLQVLQGLEKKHVETKVFDHIQVVPRLKSEVEQLHQAHTSLYNTLKRQQDGVDVLKSDLLRTQNHMTKVVEQYNKCFNSVFSELKMVKEELQKQSKIVNSAQEMHVSRPILQHPHIKSESSPQVETRQVSTLKDMASGLTTSERQILGILMSTTQKLSYKDISVEYGRSPSTIKNIICRIKSKNIPLFETAGADGIKRYYLDENFKRVLTQGRV